MDVVLPSLTKGPETGAFDLSISLGNEPARNYREAYERSDPKHKLCDLEQEILLRLSDLPV